VKTFSLSVFLTVILWAGSIMPAWAQDSGGQQSFMERAIESNAAEVELGKLAEKKSENPRVRSYAAMLVRDHTDALNVLHRLASGGSENTTSLSKVTLSGDHQRLFDRLNQLSGPDFDREYVHAMLQEHRKDVKEFEKEARSGSTGNSDAIRQKPQADTTVNYSATEERSIARDLLPSLRMHLERAQALERDLGVSAGPEEESGSNAPRHKTQD
jgi:putative membrane protein